MKPLDQEKEWHLRCPLSTVVRKYEPLVLRNVTSTGTGRQRDQVAKKHLKVAQ